MHGVESVGGEAQGPWRSQDHRLVSQAFADEEGTPRPPLVGGTSRCAWLSQDADSLFHKWRVVNCAEPSSLSASGSQEVEREQHLTGRNKQKRYLDRQARLVRAANGLFNVRVEGSIESGVRGKDWGKDHGVGYPVLTWSLGRCMCNYIDIMDPALGDDPICGDFLLFSHSLASSTSIRPG
jgi:hypothetical protein